MPHLLYIIGQPGSGKSTLAAALTEGNEATTVQKPFAHTLWGSAPVAELGARRDSFSGTDALSMSVQPKVVEWLRATPCELVLGEGDRLGNSRFFRSVLDAGFTLTIAWLATSSAVAGNRRARRAAELGANPQNPAWLKGRVSKVRRLVEEWEPLILELDGDQPPEVVRAQLAASGDPVAAMLRLDA